jgi:hypothetical protein
MRNGADAEAYWRRRAAILAAGLLALGLLAWALSGSGGSGPRPGPGPGLAQEQANRLPPAAYGSAPAGSSSPLMPEAGTMPLASGSASPSASPSDSARKRAPARTSHHQSRAGGSCVTGSVVVTVFTRKPSYGPHEEPAFDVYAVSTAARPCTFPFGAKAVRVLVMAHGRTVWDSAACPAAPSRSVDLIRGVPAQTFVTWNRRVRHPLACRGSLPSPAYGKFTAVARAGGQSSPATFFDLVP